MMDQRFFRLHRTHNKFPTSLKRQTVLKLKQASQKSRSTLSDFIMENRYVLNEPGRIRLMLLVSFSGF